MLTVNGSRDRGRRNNRRRHQVGRWGSVMLAQVDRQRLSLGVSLGSLGVSLGSLGVSLGSLGVSLGKLLMLDWLMLDWLMLDWLMLDWLMLDWLNVPLGRLLSVLLRRLSVLLRRLRRQRLSLLSVLLRRSLLSLLLSVLLPGSRTLDTILDGAEIAAQNWFLLAALRCAPLLCIKGKIQLDTGLPP
jgi:hypothetical protein